MNENKKRLHPFIWIIIIIIFSLLFIKTPVKKISVSKRMDVGKVILGNSVEWKMVQLHLPLYEQLWKEQRQKEKYEELVLNASPLYQYLLCQEAYFSDVSIFNESIEGKEKASAEDIELIEKERESEESSEVETTVTTEASTETEESSQGESTLSTEASTETEEGNEGETIVPTESSTETEESSQGETTVTTEQTIEIDANDEKMNYEKVFEYNWEEYQDLEKLKKDFFTVDATTDIPLEKLKAEGFLSKDLSIEKGGEEAKILIYHTHSQEAFADSLPGDEAGTVVGLGAKLAELLREKGFNVIHHKGQYDVECRDYAYSKALPAVESILEENPSIEVVIDIHRDAVAGDQKLISNQNGKDVAKLMFFNGLSYTKKQGKISYLENPYVEDNMAFAFQMHTLCNEYFPGSTRKIYLKGYRYNMHLRPRSMLVEVGAQANSCEEAYRAMDILAQSLDLCLSPKNED